MTPTQTPRTDAQTFHRDNGHARQHEIVVPAEFARQLERENQTFRAAQKACEDCDAPRVDRIAELESELAELREIFPRVLESVGNGSGCLPTCSVEFMREIPKEVRLVVTELKFDLAETAKDYRCLAELLDGHDVTECRDNLVRLKRELATARRALEWARMQLGKHTRPSPIDKALGETESLNEQTATP